MGGVAVHCDLFCGTSCLMALHEVRYRARCSSYNVVQLRLDRSEARRRRLAHPAARGPRSRPRSSPARSSPGEKLPPTRALAADAGINHLTAARVYRRLAEEGYVTASVGRGTFVRTPRARGRRGAGRRLAGLRAARPADHLPGGDPLRRLPAAPARGHDLARHRLPLARASTAGAELGEIAAAGVQGRAGERACPT